jgi:diguanylate cyclase (GGDEF)-like protein
MVVKKVQDTARKSRGVRRTLGTPQRLRDAAQRRNWTYAAIKIMGSIINKSVRTMDVAARYGGEEFVIIMPNTDIEYAYKAAERIRAAIEKLKFNGFGVTISVGISEFGKSTDTPEKMVGAADRALYRAKKEGKNRTKKASDNDFV